MKQILEEINVTSRAEAPVLKAEEEVNEKEKEKKKRVDMMTTTTMTMMTRR